MTTSSSSSTTSTSIIPNNASNIASRETSFLEGVTKLFTSQPLTAALLKEPRSIIFLGATGSGKSSSLNLMLWNMLDLADASNNAVFPIGVNGTTICPIEVLLSPFTPPGGTAIYSVEIIARNPTLAFELYKEFEIGGCVMEEETIFINGMKSHMTGLESEELWNNIQKNQTHEFQEVGQLVQFINEFILGKKGGPIPTKITCSIWGVKKLVQPLRLIDTVGFRAIEDTDKKSTRGSKKGQSLESSSTSTTNTSSTSKKPEKTKPPEMRPHPLEDLQLHVYNPTTIFVYVVRASKPDKSWILPPEIGTFLKPPLKFPIAEILDRTVVLLTLPEHSNLRRLMWDCKEKSNEEFVQLYKQSTTELYPEFVNLHWFSQNMVGGNRFNLPFYNYLRETTLSRAETILKEIQDRVIVDRSEVLNNTWSLFCTSLFSAIDTHAKQLPLLLLSTINSIPYGATVGALIRRRGDWVPSIPQMIINHFSSFFILQRKELQANLEQQSLASESGSVTVTFQQLTQKVLATYSLKFLTILVADSNVWADAGGTGLKSRLATRLSKWCYEHLADYTNGLLEVSKQLLIETERTLSFQHTIPKYQPHPEQPSRFAAFLWHNDSHAPERKEHLGRLWARLQTLGFSCIEQGNLTNKHSWEQFLKKLKQTLQPSQGRILFMFVYSGHGGMKNNLPVAVTSDNNLVTYSDLYETISECGDDRIKAFIIHDACLVAIPAPADSLATTRKISPQHILISGACSNGVGFSGYLLPAVIATLSQPKIGLYELGLQICKQVEAKYKTDHMLLKTTMQNFNAPNNTQYPESGWKPMMQMTFFEEEFL